MSEAVTTDHRSIAYQHAGRRWWLLAIVAVVLGTTLGITAARMARQGAPSFTSSKVFTSTGGIFTREYGVKAPAWRLPDLNRPAEVIALGQFRGHPLVVNFWASWCPPCVKEMPVLGQLAKRLSGQVDFVGLDTQDERSAGLALARTSHITYPLATDNAQVWSSYGVYGLPTTFFISATGTIVGKQVGGLTKARLEAILRQVFGVHVSPG